MINEDNASIRYLMKEMDPSEEVLMERAMMEDDNLLIEVECMRKTLKQLDKLPTVDPPSHLTDAIIREAVEHRKKSLNSSRFMPFIKFRYAAAAIVVIGTTVGGLLFYEDNTADEPSQNDAPQQTVTQAIKSSGNTEVKEAPQEMKVSSVSNDIPAPWVDRNDIIYFQDHYNTDNSAFQSLIKSSTEKLTPLNGSFSRSTGSRTLQLTGSGTRQ